MSARDDLVELIRSADTVLADVSVEQAEVLADAILAAGWKR
jgi:hypothetical protein